MSQGQSEQPNAEPPDVKARPAGPVDRFFRLSAEGTTLPRELIAGACFVWQVD